MTKLGRIITVFFKASDEVIKAVGEDHLHNYEKEKTLVQHLLDNNDGSDVHAFEFMDMKELGFKLNEAKGVFGSIVDKGLLEHDPEGSRDRKASCGEDVELYQWTYPVDYEQHGNENYEIKTTAEYLTAFENKMTSEKIEKLGKENQ